MDVTGFRDAAPRLLNHRRGHANTLVEERPSWSRSDWQGVSRNHGYSPGYGPYGVFETPLRGSSTQSQGYAIDLSHERRHHEIYLGDPRRTAPETLRTVVRHPIRPA